MNININFTGVDSTEAIKEYATDKAESLSTYFDGITGIDIDVGKRGHQQKGSDEFYAEFKVQIPTKPNLYIVKESSDLYKAIDKVRDHLKVELERIKGKMHQIDREEVREQKAYQEDL